MVDSRRMGRATAFFGLIAVLAATLVGVGGPRTAIACTIGPDYNPFLYNDYIVSGWVRGFEVDRASDPGEAFHQVWFGFEVDHAYKGSPDRFMTFTVPDSAWSDEASAIVDRAGCGALAGDVEDLYVLLALSVDLNGDLRTSGLDIFFSGRSPRDPGFDDAVARLEHPYAPAPEPPDVGTGTAATGTDASTAIWLVAVGLAMAVTGWSILWRRHPSPST